MEIKRRDFLKGVAGTAALALARPSLALAREKIRLPDAVGILYDATLCIGCKTCMVGCRKANDLTPEMQGGPKPVGQPHGSVCKHPQYYQKI